MAALPAKTYKISKKPRSDYIIKPTTPNSQEYAVHIETHASTESPFMYLHEGTSTKDVKTAVGSVRRAPDEAAFQISGNGLQDVDHLGCLTMMRKTRGLTAELEVSMSHGKPRELAWRPNFKHGLSCNLYDMSVEGQNAILAIYEEDPIFKRGGKLTLNVDWGLEFERVVITSAIGMFERTSVWGKMHFQRGGTYDAPMGRSMGVVGGFGGGYAGAGGCDGGGGGDGGGGC